MAKTKPSENEIDAAVALLNAAQSAHAAVLTYNNATKRFDSSVSEEELSALYVSSLEAERAYCVLLNDNESAEQIGYQIETENERLRRFKAGQ